MNKIFNSNHFQKLYLQPQQNDSNQFPIADTHFFARLNRKKGVYATHRIMANVPCTQIDLRLSADAVGVRNDPHQGPRSKAEKVTHFGCKSGLKMI